MLFLRLFIINYSFIITARIAVSCKEYRISIDFCHEITKNQNFIIGVRN